MAPSCCCYCCAPLFYRWWSLLVFDGHGLCTNRERARSYRGLMLVMGHRILSTHPGLMPLLLKRKMSCHFQYSLDFLFFFFFQSKSLNNQRCVSYLAEVELGGVRSAMDRNLAKGRRKVTANGNVQMRSIFKLIILFFKLILNIPRLSVCCLCSNL